MNFDKTGLEDVITYPDCSLINPWDIDICGNKLYFIDCGVGIDVIFSANLDGSAIDTVVKDVDCQFFAIDTSTSRVYWGDDNKISSARLDGSDRQDIVTSVGTFIMGIAVAHNVSATSIQDPRQALAGFKLFSNYPNPFNPSTQISYRLPVTTFVQLELFTVLGQKVQTLVKRPQSAGHHSISFYAAGLPGGVYFYRLTAGHYTATRKMILMK